MADFITPTYCILSYPHLYTPQAPAEGAEPRYSAVFVIPQTQQNTPEWTALRAAIKQVAVDKWGMELPKGIKWPVRKCEEKDGEPFDSHPDGVFVSAWSKNRPGVVGPDLAELLVPGDVFAGQLARAKLNPFAWEHRSGGKGVSLGLGNVQITTLDMDRIGGGARPKATDDFESLTDPGTAAPATADEADDDLPF